LEINDTIIEIKNKEWDSFSKNESILSSEDLKKMEAIHSSERKMEIYLSRFIIHSYLKKKIEIEYINNKPVLKNDSIHLSISHNKKYVCVGFNKNKIIGIDIETIKPSILKITSKFCQKKEIENLKNKKQLLDSESYYTMLWTAKEAVYKCIENQQNIYINNIEVILKDLNTGTAICRDDQFQLDFVQIDKETILCHAQKLNENEPI
jgi:phosphopantetheinyl transferase